MYEEITSKIGKLRFVFEEEEGALVRITLTEKQWAAAAPAAGKRTNVHCSDVRGQIEEYLDGRRKDFHLMYKLTGTPFQLDVWHALRQIPYGQTSSYSELAAAVGREKAARAVGYANSLNPLPLIFPCHRVIGKNMTLTGYAGGMEMKRQLLELEGARIR